MSRATCPHCQQAAMGSFKKCLTIGLILLFRPRCVSCGEKLYVSRFTGVMCVVIALVLMKTFTLFGTSTPWTIGVITALFLPLYGWLVRFEIPSDKHAGIDWW
jgi:hypothetical protein